MKSVISAVKLLSILLCLMMIFSCSKTPGRCLGRDVQNDIYANPELIRHNVEVKVVGVDNGYITLDLKKGFSTETRLAIYQGKSLREVEMSIDPSVRLLIDLEEIIKKRPNVKAISWTAEGWTGGEVGKGLPFQSLPGTSTSHAGIKGEEFGEDNCEE